MLLSNQSTIYRKSHIAYTILIILVIVLIGWNHYRFNYYSSPRYINYYDTTYVSTYCLDQKIYSVEKFPDRIQSIIDSILIADFGPQNLDHLSFYFGIISESNALPDTFQVQSLDDLASIARSDRSCDTTLRFPCYHVSYRLRQLKLPEARNDTMLIFDMHLDSAGTVLDPFSFPKDLQSTELKIFPIDSFHAELSKREISNRKLKVYLEHDCVNNEVYWVATKKIRDGSILGPSCFPEYKPMLTMDIFTGMVETK